MAKRGRPRKVIEPKSPSESPSKLKIKTDNEPPKKRGRKPKSAFATNLEILKTAEDVVVEAVKISDSLASAMNEEVNEEMDCFEASDLANESGRLSSLRRRKGESVVEQEAGPSNKAEPDPEFSDDDFNIDDSDSDPTWTGAASKISDSLKRDSTLGAIPPKKRGPKPSKKSSPPPPKRKKSPDRERKVVPSITIVRAKPTVKKEKPKKEIFKRELLKKEKKKKDILFKKLKKDKPPETDQFLIAKADLDQETPYLWKVDRKTHMLQRFEVTEQNGALIYQSSFTYAAWNQFSFSLYVSAKVEIISRSTVLQVVKFLGPDLSQPIQNAFQRPPSPKESDYKMEDENSVDEVIEENFDHLKENFDIFLQSLISQAVDSSFLSEIHKENDEYFLNNIKAIESVSNEKKDKLVCDFWDEELKSSAAIYPCVNVLESVMEQDQCQVCRRKKGVKLLQFYGQPYEPTSLSSVMRTMSNKTQFFVCGRCGTCVSLYSRLLHHKYNFFIKCRSKLNEVRGSRDQLESHVLLGDCLEDHAWVNSLFEELVSVWRESERNS